MKNIKFIIIALLGTLIVSCNTSAPKEEKEKTITENTNRELPLEWTKNANIYEVNLRQYSEEGTLNAFAAQLPRLKEMGVDILWFMPIHPIGELNRKGSLGSYYAVKNYKAVDPAYGTFDDFKNMVDQAHKLGMYVMLDWVANHTSWDNVWVKDHSDFYEKDSIGNYISPFDWSDVISLDYNNDEMRNAMADALKFWVADANIDGYRCDVAGEVPTDFWNWLRPQLDEIKPVFMLAEAEKSELLESAFDMDYGWEFHHIMNGVAKGEKSTKEIIEYFTKLKKEQPVNTYKMNFITNHDENSWNGTIKERMGNSEEAFSVLLYTIDGMPLTYSGQEAANEKRLEFFEKDAIQWNNYPREDFLKKVMNIKHENSALFNGNYGGEFTLIENSSENKILSYKQVNGENEILVILNLSKEDFHFTMNSVKFSEYEQVLVKELSFDNEKQKFSAKPWSYAVLKK